MISVIIPVKNGEGTLEKCLDSIRLQTIADQIEIIVLDSMSGDKSKKIAEKFGATVIDIPNGTFNHGLTRNIGLQHANGELIYYTVQDAYLAENDQLKKMADHFNDKEVQSVTGIQAIPNDLDKNPAAWFRRFSQPVPETFHFEPDIFKNFSREKQLGFSRWDNVNSMYRSEALQKLPFRKTEYAEDIFWAHDALSFGMKIMRDPSIMVYHYHHHTFRYVFNSAYQINYTLWKHFDIKPVLPGFIKPLFQNVHTVLKRENISFFRKVNWVVHNIVRHIAFLLSTLTFKIVYTIGNRNWLDKSYKYFCSVMPQGSHNVSYKNAS